MASATLTTMDAVVRELWPQSAINQLVFSDHPFLAMVPKKTDFTEKIRHIALQYGRPQGRSATFADAQNNAVASKFAEFQLTRVDDYAVFTIDGETLESTKDKKAAIVSALMTETKGALAELGRSLHRALWGSGTGSIGSIKAATTPDTSIELANVEDVVNFEVGMTLVASATDGGALGGTGTTVITDVNRDTGILTVATDVSGLGHPWVAGDYLYQEGDEQAAGTALRVSGVPAWVPTSTPTSTAFFGLDRTTDTTRMGGVRYDGSSDGTKKEALIRAAARLRREGGKMPDVIFMHPEDCGDLLVEIESSVQYGKVTGRSESGEMATISFDTIKLRTPAGTLDVVEDYQCPKGYAWMLRMDTWCFASLGAAPRILDHDGLTVLRQSSADGVEGRAVYRGQLYCDAPGWNAVVTLPT